MSTVASFFVVIVGEMQRPVIERTQPMKDAVLENSGVAEVQAQLVKEHGPGDYVPWQDTVRISMDVMTIIGNTVSTITFIALFLLWKDRLMRWRWASWILVVTVPFPFVASVGGWVVREVGRQPWIVYGELTVEDALSHVGRASLLVSCTLFVAIFLALAVTNWALITRFALRGPDATQLGATEPLPDDVPEGPEGSADEKQPLPAL
ncbi:cytochrome ubiquinol oxidase subunit I [Streptomyces sp. KN37]|uniref:cytochrome ubiquinol oxidase subunit I n=1 Tax=Streptomyces sp. KN37 TaxID=3090667 RepID=UPI002A74D7AA|nr:cytochrome ubiquinol oxidase subunit I [Streptomyces sp. KN37]WPO76156.1 cytochrome ubiquinol oxidase subunit I [Streptomyces sp. KN37]